MTDIDTNIWDNSENTEMFGDFFGVEGTAVAPTTKETTLDSNTTITETNTNDKIAATQSAEPSTKETYDSFNPENFGNNTKIEETKEVKPDEVKPDTEKPEDKPASKNEEKNKPETKPTDTTSKPDTTVEPTQVQNVLKNTANLLFEQNVFTSLKEEDLENFTGSDEEFIDLQNKEVDTRVQEVLEGWQNKLTGDGADFVKYSMNGGSLKDFVETRYTEFSYTDSKIETEDQQEALLFKHMRINENKSEEDIKEEILFLKDKGKLKARAESVKERGQAAEDKLREDQVKNIENQNIVAEKRRKERKKSFSTMVSEIDSVSSIKLDKVAKKELPGYITDPVHAEDNGNYLTGLHNDLKSMFSDPESLLQLATVIRKFDKSKKEFDFTDLVKAGKKAANNEAASRLVTSSEGNNTVVVPTKGETSNANITTIADLFDD